MFPNKLESDYLIVFDNDYIRVYSPNIHKAGGTIFIYLHKPSGQILVVDCGIGFDSGRMKKQDDPTQPNVFDEVRKFYSLICSLIGNTSTLIHLFLTHGHFDHIIGVNDFCKEFNVLVHCSETSKAMIYRAAMKERDSKIPEHIKFDILGEFDVRQAGIFLVKCFPAVHSIPETLSFIIQTIEMNILHMSEFRTKESSCTPGLREKMFKGIKMGCADRPYDLVFYDKLRSEHGYAQPEDVIREAIEAILNRPDFKEEAAIIIPFISSKVWQIAIIQQIANKHGCIMMPAGRAMREMVAYARKRGWVEQQIPRNEIEGNKYKAIIYICTGSQDEPGSAFPNAINIIGSQMSLDSDDIVFMAQCLIPMYREQGKAMYLKALEKTGRLVLGRNEANQLGFERSEKIIFAEDILGTAFSISSGHGKARDQEEVLEAAICNDGNYIGYQSEEEEDSEMIIDETEIDQEIETKEDNSKKQILEVLWAQTQEIYRDSK